MPDDPKNEEYNEYVKAVERPLSLESIRVYLKYNGIEQT